MNAEDKKENAIDDWVQDIADTRGSVETATHLGPGKMGTQDQPVDGGVPEGASDDGAADETSFVRPPRMQQQRRAATAHRASLLFFANPASTEGHLGGLYGFAIARATDGGHERSWWSAAWAPLAVFALLLAQIWIMWLIAWESSHVSCLEHDDCRLGQFCPPQRYCLDCNALESLDFLADTDVAEEDVEGFLGHCYNNADNGNDEMPQTCDYLFRNVNRIDPGAAIVLVFVALLVALEMLIDIDQEAQDQRLWAYWRAKISSSSARPLPRLVGAIIWINHIVRLFILPASVVSGILALILPEPITAHNLLLNGLAITFANRMDELLGNFLLRPEHRSHLNEAVKEMMLSEEEETMGSASRRSGLSVDDLKRARRKSSYIWCFNRLYAVALMLVIVIGVVCAKQLMSIFALPWRPEPVCGNIGVMTILWPITCIVGGVLPFYYILLCRDRWWPSGQSSGRWHRGRQCFHCFTAVVFDVVMIAVCFFFMHWVFLRLMYYTPLGTAY